MNIEYQKLRLLAGILILGVVTSLWAWAVPFFGWGDLRTGISIGLIFSGLHILQLILLT